MHAKDEEECENRLHSGRLGQDSCGRFVRPQVAWLCEGSFAEAQFACIVMSGPKGHLQVETVEFVTVGLKC